MYLIRGILYMNLLIILSAKYLSSYNELKIFDDSHFFPNEGIYLEPAGHYLSYSGSIHIPFIYVLPSIDIPHLLNCPNYKDFEKTHQIMLSHIQSIVGEKNTRVTRSLFPIISVLTGGLSVWNTVEIQNMKNKIIGLQYASNHIDKSIKNIVDSQNLMISRIGEVSTLLGDQSKLIKYLYNMTSCLDKRENDFNYYISTWLSTAPFEFISAYSGAVTGTVTPELLSANNLHQVLLAHNEMLNTMYIIDPSIIYELGKTLLLEVKVSKQTAYMKGLIQVPKILSINPEPLYTIYKTNILHNDTDISYIVPDLLICPSLTNCREPPVDNCIKKSARLICLYGTDQPENKCFNDIVNNRTDNCKTLIRRHTKPVVIQTQSGILLGGTRTKTKVYRRDVNVDTLSKTISPSNSAILITAKDGDWITRDDTIYSTKITGFEYNFTTYFTRDPQITTYDINKLDYNWKSLEKLKYDPVRFDNIDNKNGLYILVILVEGILIILVIILYLKIFLRKNRPQRISAEEFVGLR